MENYGVENSVMIFLGFLDKVRQIEGSVSRMPKRVRVSRKLPKRMYLVRSPRKNNPGRKIWRIKRQCLGAFFIKHFEESERDKAVELAGTINSLSKTEFTEFVKNN